MSIILHNILLLRIPKSVPRLTIVLIATFLTTFTVHAQSIRDQVNSIAKGESKISIMRNHPSAPQLVLGIRYPSQWAVQEVAGSIVLQQFIEPNNSRLDTRCVVIAQPAPNAPADDRKQAEFAWTISPESHIPLAAKLLEKNKVMLDGRYGWKLSYEASRPTPSINAQLRSVVYLTYAKGYSIILMCTCAGKIEDSHLVAIEYDKQLPLFDIMATSIVVGREP